MPPRLTDLDIAYASLGTYVTEHELSIAGSLRETCVVGPGDTDDTSAWRTEVGLPIVRTTPPS
jgi:effector-binding domain-containing protein